MLSPPQPQTSLIEDWLKRHSNRVNLFIHLVSIPVSIIGFLLVPIAFVVPSWRVGGVAVGLFVLGYVGQFAGHIWDRTMPGELMALANWWSRGRRRRPAGNSG